MNRSLKDTLKITSCKLPVAVTADANATGVQTSEFGSLAFLVHVGTPDAAFDATNKVSINLEESDDDSTYAVVDADGMFDGETPASGIFKILDDTADKDQMYVVHYRGVKKFARIALDVSGTVSCVIGVSAVQGHSELQPPL